MDQFDFIIVGAGSSGCVLASKLSENGKFTVLLIEAGPADTSSFIHMPKGFVKLIADPNHCWAIPYVHGREAGSRQGMWLGGKMLGGSNSINGAVYSRGRPQDFDDWASQGGPGWSWNDVGPTFKTMEDHELGEAASRGAGGPVHLQVNRARLPLHHLVIQAGIQIGLPYRQDINDPEWDEGIGYSVWNIRKGRRWGTAQSFLSAASHRPNLRILTNTQVARIQLEGKRAIAVECIGPAGTQIFRAGREIVICAGVVHSPKLLQLSGVGPADALRSAGQKVNLDLPGVGRNLRDHYFFRIQYRVDSQRLSTNREYGGVRLIKNVMQYQLTHTGPMAWGASEIGARIKTRPGLDRSDAHLVMQSFSLPPPKQGAAFTLETEPGFSVVAAISRSQTQGSVTIQSSRPADAPVIEYSPLSAEGDQQIAPPLLRYVRKYCQQPALAPHIEGETMPGREIRSDDEIIAAFKELGSLGLHTVGTCRMGQDTLAVVDERLRVRGLEGLRVADCSIVPNSLSGTGGTSATAMMIGWRAAEILLADAARAS